MAHTLTICLDRDRGKQGYGALLDQRLPLLHHPCGDVRLYPSSLASLLLGRPSPGQLVTVPEPLSPLLCGQAIAESCSPSQLCFQSERCQCCQTTRPRQANIPSAV